VGVVGVVGVVEAEADDKAKSVRDASVKYFMIDY
jgi:hypothetical protein